MSARQRPCFVRRAALGACTCVLLGSLAPAQGGPPLRTDDPGTPGDGRFEINVAMTMERDEDGTLLEAPLLDLNYGWGDRVQLKYEVPWIFADEEGASAKNGFGNSLAGVKWRFSDALGRGPAVSVYPQVEFENPGSSSAERGIVEEGTSLLVPLEAAWELEELGVGLEVGRSFHESAGDSWIAGFAMSKPVSQRTEFLAEIHAEASADLDASQGMVQIGSRTELATGRVLLASVGDGLWCARSDRPGLSAYLGIQFVF